MRTSNKSTRAGLGGALQIIIAGTLATAAVVATTATVSKQDIAALANVKTADENRWLAHLVEVPSGSKHVAALNGKTKFSVATVDHTMGLQTVEDLHLLGQPQASHSGVVAKINRAMMGDRVFTPKPVEVALVPNSATDTLLSRTSLVTGSINSKTLSADTLIAAAQTFRQPTMAGETVPNIDVANLKPKHPDQGVTTAGQMKQAREAARQMAKVVEQVKREQTILASNATVSTAFAYAADTSPMASAFAAVLRPTLRKSITPPSLKDAQKPKQKKVREKSTLKKAVAALKRKTRRSIIRLAKGDHKWAAYALPKSSYSRNQRRCLAVGVYFEARSESRKGQQAVAQVILNRVKNPTYPNSICGVVYQNKWKRNACQFSFACDGKRDRVNSKKHWRKSVKVANDAIDGRVWLRRVGSSSHYHADYVWPRWRKSMRKMVKIGRHIFYRTYGGGWS